MTREQIQRELERHREMVKRYEKDLKATKYPYIGRNTYTGNVVLFSAPATGVVVIAGDSHVLGYASDLLCEGNFTPCEIQVKP